MDANIGVTVFCTTYNHEKYVAKTLESFLCQKTDFPVEIVVHDDASTDGTIEIIKEYAEKYSNIVPIFEEKNMYSKGVSYAWMYAEKLHGKYIALCEGDDYWCSPDKLQKQYDALEANPDCRFCTHKTQEINVVLQKATEIFPQFKQKTKKLSANEVLSQMGLFGTCYRTSSFFCSKEDLINYYNNVPEFKKAADVGDGPLLMYFCQLGKTYFINETMSCYSRGVTGGWTTKIARDKERRLKHFDCWINCINLYNEYTQGKYDKECRQMLLYWDFEKQIFLQNFSAVLDPKYKEILKSKSLKYKIKSLLNILKQKFAGRQQ